MRKNHADVFRPATAAVIFCSSWRTWTDSRQIVGRQAGAGRFGPGFSRGKSLSRFDFNLLDPLHALFQFFQGQLPASVGLQQFIIDLFLGLQIMADQEQIMTRRAVARTPASPMGQMALIAPISRSSLAMTPGS